MLCYKRESDDVARRPYGLMTWLLQVAKGKKSGVKSGVPLMFGANDVAEYMERTHGVNSRKVPCP